MRTETNITDVLNRTTAEWRAIRALVDHAYKNGDGTPTRKSTAELVLNLYDVIIDLQGRVEILEADGLA